jgi:hypothetical protein
VLTIAGLGLFSLGSMATTGNTRNFDQAAAAALAEAKLEDLRNGSFTSLVAGSYSDGPLTAGGASGGIFSRSWTIASTTISGVSTPAKNLTATVTWTGGGSISMSTMVVEPAEVNPGFLVGFPTATVNSMAQTR